MFFCLVVADCGVGFNGRIPVWSLWFSYVLIFLSSINYQHFVPIDVTINIFIQIWIRDAYLHNVHDIILRRLYHFWNIMLKKRAQVITVQILMCIRFEVNLYDTIQKCEISTSVKNTFNIVNRKWPSHI